MTVRPDSTMGFRTGSKLLLVFMFAFFGLGYTLFLSVCLGTIAALTGGFISSWWHAKEDYITDEATEAAIAEDEAMAITSAQPRSTRYGFGVRPARQIRPTPERPARGVGWLFRRNR